MFTVNYASGNTKCVVHVEFGEELDYAELVAIRQEVQQLCDGCKRYVAIYDYHKKPQLNNFSITVYRKLSGRKLDIVINLGMNPVQRSFVKLVHSIKPASKEIHFADNYDEAIALAKALLPE